MKDSTSSKHVDSRDDNYFQKDLLRGLENLHKRSFNIKDYLDVDVKTHSFLTHIEYKDLKYAYDEFDEKYLSANKIHIGGIISDASEFYLNQLLKSICIYPKGFSEVPLIDCDITEGSITSEDEYHSLMHKIIFSDIALLSFNEEGRHNYHSMGVDDSFDCISDFANNLYLKPLYSISTVELKTIMSKKEFGFSNVTDVTVPFYLITKSKVMRRRSYEAQCRFLRWLDNDPRGLIWSCKKDNDIDERLEHNLVAFEKIIKEHIKNKGLILDTIFIDVCV